MRDTPTMTFWDHLDELRGVIVRVLVVTVIGASVAFCLKDELFAIVLAPRSSDFITYQLLGVEPFCVNSSALYRQRSMTTKGNTPHCSALAAT